jgi:ADP-ribose pyrophosphatase
VGGARRRLSRFHRQPDRARPARAVGGSSDDWLYIGSFNTGASTFEEPAHIVLARDVRLDREPCREPAEIIEVHPVSIERALEMARSGEIADGHSALALLRCEPYLREQCP